MITIVTLYTSVECSIVDKINDLSKNIFSGIHNFVFSTKLRQFKSILSKNAYNEIKNR